jgi:hypothetical protein
MRHEVKLRPRPRVARAWPGGGWMALLLTSAVGVVAPGCDAGSSGGGAVDAGADDRADGSAEQPTGQISIAIGAGTNICPTVTVTAAPPSSAVGSSIDLHAWAVDPDASDAGMTRPLNLTWTAPAGAGTLSDPTAAETRFACARPGLQVVTVAVSDGRCTQTETVALHCLATDAGVADSVLDGSSGRAGGAPAGSGGADGSVGRSSSGGAFGSGGATGSGGVSGSGVSASSGGAPGTGATGRGGTAGAPAAFASGGSPGSGGAAAGGGGPGGKSGPGGGSGGASHGSGGSVAVGGSSATPSTDEGDACNTCTAENCNIATDGCAVIGFQSPSDAPLCESLYACLRSQHCTSDDDDDMLPDQDSSQWCWCGLPPDAEATDCFTRPGTAKGPCLADIVKAAHTSDPATIRLRFADPTYPLGRAANLANCRSAYCGSVCR